MADLHPNDVVRRLVDLSRMLDAAQVELEAQDEQAVRSRARHEVAYARAFLTAEESNAEGRKCRAILITATEKLDAEIADQKTRALRTRISVLREQVEIGRSLSAALRAEWNAGAMS